MSSDGLRHEGEIAAPDKDSAYAELRKRGIRAIRVTERIRPIVRKGLSGLRKRDIVCLVLCAVCLAVFAWFIATRSATGKVESAPVNQTISSGIVQLAQPHPRKWLALPPSCDIKKVFGHPHEVYLARYALPGVEGTCAVHRASCAVQGGERCSLNPELVQDFYDNLNAGIVIQEDDDPVVAELKRIVAGMKEDARKYLTMPNGIERLATWLEERQQMEKSHRDQFVLRVKQGRLSVQEANDVFRAMGLEELK